MSNQIVGAVYQTIIDKVIQASSNDFEEFGVDQTTLDEMKSGWQEKLSSLKVANFPWDPPEQSRQQPPTLPSNVKHETNSAPQVQAAADHVNFPNIKSERFDGPPMSAYPQVQNGYQSGFNGDVAQQRAQALVAQRLGHPVPTQQHGGQVPMHGQQQRVMPGQQQQQQRPPQQMQQQRPQQPHVYTSQTDGADEDAYSENALAEWKAFKAAREAAGEQGRILADETMRAQLDAMAHTQDSGLMVPLSEHPSGRKRKDINRVLQRQQAERQVGAPIPSVAGPAGFDGPAEEVKEEDPDDAINSDLDDSDDGIENGDDDDDDNVDYMLCTYDKVQRVKNKWKCTLKDGILTTNKKEYLFHKATGEFEW